MKAIRFGAAAGVSMRSASSEGLRPWELRPHGPVAASAKDSETAMEGWLPTMLGSLAGLLSTSSFLPQVVKAIRQGDTGAISKRMYIVTVTAFVLWIAYGFVIGALPLVIFNSLSLLLSGTILFLKIRNDRRVA
jgi:MtN3 and saliva related transmembrane protein